MINSDAPTSSYDLLWEKEDYTHYLEKQVPVPAYEMVYFPSHRNMWQNHTFYSFYIALIYNLFVLECVDRPFRYLRIAQ